MTNINLETATGIERELKRIGDLDARPPEGLSDAVIGAIAHADVVRACRRVTALVASGVLVGGMFWLGLRSRQSRRPG